MRSRDIPSSSICALWAGLLGLCVACSDAVTSSSLELVEDGGVPEVTAHWTYRSSSVDVDLRVTTVQDETSCATHTQLDIDKAISGTDRYVRDLSCDELTLTSAGDLVLLGATTGHDWSSEALDVDTGRERIYLGPWSPADAGEQSYRFTLFSRECGDCDCPELHRTDGAELLMLHLGRYCD